MLTSTAWADGLVDNPPNTRSARATGALPAVLGALLVKVKVLFFASLREQLGTGAEEIDAARPASARSRRCARICMRAAAPGQSALADKKVVRVAVNQDMAQPARRSRRATRWRSFRR